MDWQNCMEFGGGSGCVGEGLPKRGTQNTTLCGNRTNSVGTFIRGGKLGLTNFLHAMVHYKFGADLFDVATSPNEAGPFSGT